MFCSDQWLAGQFNEVMAEYIDNKLANFLAKTVCAVGEHIQSRLSDRGLMLETKFSLRNSIHAITPLTGQILSEMEELRVNGEMAQL